MRLLNASPKGTKLRLFRLELTQSTNWDLAPKCR